MIKREKIGKSEIKISVSLNSEKWEQAQFTAFQKLSSKLEIPGFRVGKVPSKIAEDKISQNQIWQEAISKVVDKMAKEAQVEIKPEDIVVSGPVYNINKITKTELELGFIYVLYPEVKIGKYLDITSSYKVEPVLPKDIETEIENVQKRLITWNVIDLPLKKGLKAKFDFEGFVDGKPFEGGKAANYELVIGSKAFIPGFEEQMIGLVASDTKDIKVTFPKDYHDTKLADKSAVFKVKIHSVMEENIPAIDDTLAVEANVANVKTINDLRGYIQNALEETRLMQGRKNFMDDVFEEIRKTTKVELPQVLLAQETERITRYYRENLTKQGLPQGNKSEFDSYLKTMTPMFQKEAEKQLMNSLIFSEIARAEKIKVNEDDFDSQYKRIAKIYGQPIEEIKSKISKQQLQAQMLNDKVIDFLILHHKEPKPTLKKDGNKTVKKTTPKSKKNDK